MAPVQCFTCNVDILLNHKWYKEGTHESHKTRFCSPQCKFMYIFRDREPESCWLYGKKCIVIGTRVYSIRCLSYLVHYKEVVTAPQIFLLCGSKMCANPRHMRRKEELQPKQIKDYYRSCL